MHAKVAAVTSVVTLATNAAEAVALPVSRAVHNKTAPLRGQLNAAMGGGLSSVLRVRGAAMNVTDQVSAKLAPMTDPVNKLMSETLAERTLQLRAVATALARMQDGARARFKAVDTLVRTVKDPVRTGSGEWRALPVGCVGLVGGLL